MENEVMTNTTEMVTTAVEKAAKVPNTKGIAIAGLGFLTGVAVTIGIPAAARKVKKAISDKKKEKKSAKKEKEDAAE